MTSSSGRGRRGPARRAASGSHAAGAVAKHSCRWATARGRRAAQPPAPVIPRRRFPSPPTHRRSTCIAIIGQPSSYLSAYTADDSSDGWGMTLAARISANRHLEPSSESSSYNLQESGQHFGIMEVVTVGRKKREKILERSSLFLRLHRRITPITSESRAAAS